MTLAEESHRTGESTSAVELSQEVSDLKSQIDRRDQALKQAHLDIETLSAELEELDKQNQEATQVFFLSQCSMVIRHKED